ncbi:hypothetical protein ANAEL_00106 [Anaerolineales bacterium]|nr:hypothetical protein ANAEL_00106 [Anaerolineales bacterium]
MRTFYTGSDIEDMAASGIRQLEVGPGVVLTDAARQQAEELGIVLVVPGATPANKTGMPIAAAKSGTLPGKPRGCQHGPLSAVANRDQSTTSGGPVVDQLVEAVSALKKRGD